VAAPSNFLSIVRPFFVLLSGVIAGPPEQRWLRPIDAGNRDELLATSRDRNVIDGSCNAHMRSPYGRSSEAAVIAH
jgi:hypothetical protein